MQLLHESVFDLNSRKSLLSAVDPFCLRSHLPIQYTLSRFRSDSFGLQIQLLCCVMRRVSATPPKILYRYQASGSTMATFTTYGPRCSQGFRFVPEAKRKRRRGFRTHTLAAFFVSAPSPLHLRCQGHTVERYRRFRLYMLPIGILSPKLSFDLQCEAQPASARRKQVEC